ncbi:MAG: hypothetical protein KTR31_32365 [Myxococcales bacterium]|nr:hypothetical protein [Myxococcales bacterium]
MHRIRHWARIISITMLGLLAASVVGSWIAVNVWLSSEAFHDLLNERPDRLRIEYSSVWMGPTGRITAEDLRLVAHDRRSDWMVELPRVSFSIDTQALRQEVFRASDVRGRGLRFRMRSRPVRGQQLPAGVPEIEGVLPQPAEPIPDDRVPGWVVHLTDIAVSDVAEVWVDGVRLDGQGDLGGALWLRAKDRIGTQGLSLSWSDGRLMVDGESVAEPISGQLDTRLRHTTFGAKQSQVLANLGSRVRVKGTVAGIGFLQPMFANADRLALRGGGDLYADVTLRESAFAPGSVVTLSAEHLEAILQTSEGEGEPDLRLASAGTVAARITEGPQGAADDASLTVTLHDARVLGMGSKDVNLLGQRLEVRVLTRKPTLEDGFVEPDVMLALDIPDLTRLNGLVPANLGLQIESGVAVVAGALDGHGSRLGGTLSLDTEAVGLLLGERDVTGNLDVDVVYDASQDAGLSVAGTAVRFETSDRGMDVRLDVREGRVGFEVPSTPTQSFLERFRPGDGRFVVVGRVSDLAPLNELAVFPSWLRLHGGVAVNSTLLVRQGQLQPGSEVYLDARRLSSNLEGWDIAGQARFRGAMRPADREEISLSFAQVALGRDGVQQVAAPAMSVHVVGTDLVTDPGMKGMDLTLEVQPGELLDLALVNQWLPPDVLAIRSGGATIGGQAVLSSGAGQVVVGLDGRELALSVGGFDFGGELALDVLAQTDDIEAGAFDVTGSQLVLSGIRGALDDGLQTEPWSSEIRLTRADVQLDKPLTVDGTADLFLSDVRPLLALLAGEHGEAADWFATFFEGRDDDGLATRDVQGTVAFTLGDEGIEVRKLEVNAGGVHVESDLRLPPASDQDTPTAISVRGKLEDLPPIAFEDLNNLLPVKSGFAFSSGTGELSGWVEMDEHQGQGRLGLVGRDIEVAIGGESVQTGLRTLVKMRSGDPKSLRYNVSGTRIVLDDTQWLADPRAAYEPGWWGEITLNNAEVLLQEPLEVNADLFVEMRDLRPLVYVIGKRHGLVRWFNELVELGRVIGRARMNVTASGVRFDHIDIRAARAHGPQQDPVARVQGFLHLGPDGADGLLHLRVHQVGAAVELHSNDRRLRLISPRRWFEERRRAWDLPMSPW